MLDLFVERMEKAATRDDLFRLTFELRDHYAIGHVWYRWVNAETDAYEAGTYSREWAERYARAGYLRVDPVVQGCFQRAHPVIWKQLDWSSRAARELMADAIAHGIGTQGYSIPLRGPNGQFALFTANDTCADEVWARFCNDNMRDLMVVAHYFNQKTLELEGITGPTGRTLSPREADSLTFLALGYSRAQVATTLEISEHTLRVYVESARHKLGAMNTTHAVARAMALGLIVV